MAAVAARTRRAEPATRARLRRATRGGGFLSAADGTRARRRRADAARRSRRGRRPPARSPRGSARCAASAARRPRWRWLTAVWEKTEAVPGPPFAESRLLRAGARARRARGAARGRESSTAAGAHREPRPQGALPVRHAGAVCRFRGRERWFLSLADVTNRRREPWVLDGLDYLHHPLRARAVRQVRAARASTCCGNPEDRRHLLPEALDGRHARRLPAPTRPATCATSWPPLPPNYPARLKNIVLQSADELFRAADRQ